MLPLIYAQALYKSSRGKSDLAPLFVNLKAILERKGHSRLLPQIAREYEKLLHRGAVEDQGVLEVAHKADVTHLKAQIEAACAELNLDESALDVRENKELIGGFLLRKKSVQIDGSYRRRLIELYRQLVAA